MYGREQASELNNAAQYTAATCFGPTSMATLSLMLIDNLSHDVIDYVTHLAPPTNCLVGGDFNAWHDTFEPGVQSAHQGAELARWSSDSCMDFIGTPGELTQTAGH